MARVERETRKILGRLPLSDRDRGIPLSTEADNILSKLNDYPNRTSKSMLSGIEWSLGHWDHVRLGDYLGRTPDQIRRYIQKGLPWQSLEKMMPRIEALFAITLTLDDQYGDDFNAKEKVLTKKDEVQLGGLSLVDLISIGETQIPLALTNRFLEGHRQNGENQRGLGIDDMF